MFGFESDGASGALGGVSAGEGGTLGKLDVEGDNENCGGEATLDGWLGLTGDGSGPISS